MTNFEKVKEFREKMGLPVSAIPLLLSAKQASYFSRFMLEELSEYMRATEELDLVNATDALADLVYVALGCAHAMGIPFDTVFDAVHTANMQKRPADETHRSPRGSQYDVVKPEGWVSPQQTIAAILEETTYENFRSN